jgi:hypothetical protein
MFTRATDRSQLIKRTIIDKVLSAKRDNSDILKLLGLIFYNSNTFDINEISLNHLFQEVFSDRMAIEKFASLQFNVNETEIDDFNGCLKIHKNIKFLA